MITVSKSKITDKLTGLLRACKYSDVPKDPNGWVFNLDYLPIPFDLMYLKLKDAPNPKSGWWSGLKWKGLRLKPEDQIIAWKRNLEYD